MYLINKFEKDILENSLHNLQSEKTKSEHTQTNNHSDIEGINMNEKIKINDDTNLNESVSSLANVAQGKKDSENNSTPDKKVKPLQRTHIPKIKTKNINQIKNKPYSIKTRQMKRKSNQNTPQNDDDNDENSSKEQEKTKEGTNNTKNYKRKSNNEANSSFHGWKLSM